MAKTIYERVDELHQENFRLKTERSELQDGIVRVRLICICLTWIVVGSWAYFFFSGFAL